MKKFLRSILLLVILFFGIWLLLTKVNILQPLKNLFSEAPVTIDSTPIIIREIKSMAKLMTITFTDEVVKDTSKPGSGMPSFIPLGPGGLMNPSRDKLVLIGRGRVILGTDLKGLNRQDIHIAGDSLTVEIPRAIILETIINPSGYEVFEEKGTWPEQAVINMKLQIKEEIEKRAIAQNLLALANERSIMILETLLKNTGFKTVEVILKNEG